MSKFYHVYFNYLTINPILHNKNIPYLHPILVQIIYFKEPYFILEQQQKFKLLSSSTAATPMNSKQEGSLVFGPLTNHRAVAVKCILGCHIYCQGAVLKTNHGGHQGGINNFT